MVLLAVSVSPFIDILQSTVTCPLHWLESIRDNGISEHPIYMLLTVHVAVSPTTLADPYGYEEPTNEGLDPLVVLQLAVIVASSMIGLWHVASLIMLVNVISDQVFASYTASEPDEKYTSI